MEELLKQQYQREEKTRLKNKQAERLLHHGIESKKGIRALHEYRIQIVNRQQKELLRELEKIQADMPKKRVRKVAASASRETTTHKESKPPTTSQRHRNPWASATAATSPSRRLSKSVFDDDYDDDYDDDENQSDDDSDNDAVPDPDLLKVIMKGMVSEWERRASRAVETHRRQSLANAKLTSSSPEILDLSNSSLLQQTYKGHKSKWTPGHEYKSPHSSRKTSKEGEKHRNQSPNSVHSSKQEQPNDKNVASNKKRNGKIDQYFNANTSVMSTTRTSDAEKAPTQHYKSSRFTIKKVGEGLGDPIHKKGGKQGRIIVDKDGAHFLDGPDSVADHNATHSSFVPSLSKTRTDYNDTSLPKIKNEDKVNLGFLSERSGLFDLNLGTRSSGQVSDRQSDSVHLAHKSALTSTNSKHLMGGQVDTNVNPERGYEEPGSSRFSRGRLIAGGRTSGRSTGDHNSLFSSRSDYVMMSETPVTARSTMSLPARNKKQPIISPQNDHLLESPLSPVRSPVVQMSLLRSHSGNPNANVFSKNPKLHFYQGKTNMSPEFGRNKKLKGRIIMKIKNAPNMFSKAGMKSAPVGNGSQTARTLPPLPDLPSEVGSQNAMDSKTGQDMMLSKRYTRHSRLDDAICRDQLS